MTAKTRITKGVLERVQAFFGVAGAAWAHHLSLKLVSQHWGAGQLTHGGQSKVLCPRNVETTAVPPFFFRSAVTEDVPAIVEVRSDAIRSIEHEGYDRSALEEWVGPVEGRIQKLLSNSADIRIVAETGQRIIGYGELVTPKNLLGACYVLPSAGGQGVGRAIVAELERLAREQGLDHLHMESSANAEPFYIRCGYQVVERGRHTMPSGAAMDCVMMRKELRRHGRRRGWQRSGSIKRDP